MRAFVLAMAAVLAGCGGDGGGEVADSAGPTNADHNSNKTRLASKSMEGVNINREFSIATGDDVMKRLYFSILTDSDPHNDGFASMMLEAGGLAAYVSMDSQSRSELRSRYGVVENAESELLPAEQGSMSIWGPAATPCVMNLPASDWGKSFRPESPTIVHNVDGFGRAGLAAAVYTAGFIPPAARSTCQATVGTWGAPPSGLMPNRGYQGGHLIANSLGGTHRRYNLVPQATDINVSTMPRIENAVRSCARRSDRQVEYGVLPVYYEPGNPFSSVGVTPVGYAVAALVRKQCPSGLYQCGGGGVSFSIPNWTSVSGGMWVGPTPSHGPFQSSLALINQAVDVWVTEFSQFCQ